MRHVVHALLREEVWSGRLPGGGRLWVVPRTSRRCHVQLSVDFGALDDGAYPELPLGVAHFLEHRLFEKPEGDISERFTDLGADVDAGTGLSSTAYSFTVVPEAFAPAMRTLFELVGRGHFPDDGVQREQAIISREIQLFEDSIEWVAPQAALVALYGDQRTALDIAGTPESLMAIDASLLTACHRRYYHPGALELVVCGPVEGAAVAELATELTAAWPVPPAPDVQRPGIAARPSTRAAHCPVPRPRRLLAFAGPDGHSGADLLRRELSLELTLDILFGPSSAFFARHYESGLIDGDSFGGEVCADRSFFYCVVGGDCDEPERLQHAILDELSSAPQETIERGFSRAWRRAYGEMVCRWEEVESCADLLESATLRGCHPLDLVGLYVGERALDVDDLIDRLDDCLRVDAVATATVGPSG